MGINLSNMSAKELSKLEGDIEKELKSREKEKLDAARKAADAAAKKHGFSLNELVGSIKAKAKKQPSPAKYKNPDDPNQTWSGRGRQPVWFKDAVAAGKDPKSLEV